MFFFTVSRRQVLRRAALLFLFALLVGTTALFSSDPRFASVTGESDLPLTRAATTENRVALTFDATWGQEELARILTVLESQQVPATFFVGGTFLTLNGETIKGLASKGHEVGTLGQRIIDLSTKPEAEVTSNLLASQSTLQKILGGPVRYFRPPQGQATPSVVRAAREANLVAVTHSLDSEDHLGLKAPAIVQRVVKSATKGDIIRLSASDWSKETAKALPGIISGLQKKGFKLVRLSELVPQEGTP